MKKPFALMTQDGLSVSYPLEASRFMTTFISREFSRYFVAGGLAFGCDFLVLATLTELAGVNYLISNVFGFCVGLIISYLLCIRWVFTIRRLQVPTHEFGVFALLALVGLGLNEVTMWLVVESVGLHYTLAKIAATGVVFLVNFGMKKLILFR